MIEKLHLEEFELYNTDQKTRNLSLKINEIIDLLKELKEINKKYDELFDACCESINVHERQIDKLQMALESNLPDGDDAIQEVKHKEPADPYAEQRKWIGKLCRFWNFEDGAVDMGILKAVDNLKPTIPYINDIDCSYAFCEPVKPDDDIIYKGE